MEGQVPYDNPDVPDDNPNCTSNDNKGTHPEPNTKKIQRPSQLDQDAK